MKSRRTTRYNGSFRVAALLAAACVLLAVLLALMLLRGARTRTAEAEARKGTPAPQLRTAAVADDPAQAGPEPADTQAPMPAFTFTPDESHPLPGAHERLRYGQARTLGGTVTCNDPITRITAMIARDYCEDPFYPYMASVSFAPESNVTSYRLTDDDTVEGVSLASLLNLNTLKVGLHTLVLTGVCTNACMPSSEVLSIRFYVLDSDWKQFAARDFSNNSYETALAFFGGDTERFLYRYQNVDGRYTVADPDWESRYIIEFPMDGGDPWLIHIDAVPYYEKLRAYLDTTHVRVHGTNGDTGVLPLNQLIVAYHGSYVSRFTSAAQRYISHHALGATTDVNAIMEPNKNTGANNELVDNEVRNLLAYNGIYSDADTQYYDFTYSGSYRCTDFGVPESVINYLLYELAFYRAGFQWGHYYNSTSDAMHFSLTDNIRTRHDGAGGLQKVTEYYN